MSKLKDLELLTEQKMKEYHRIRDKRDALKELIEKPGRIEKYKGKYFKYENSISRDQKWWIYVYVVDVPDSSNLIINAFERSPYDAKFRISETSFDYICQTPITKSEYKRAFDRFIKLAYKLQP